MKKLKSCDKISFSADKSVSSLYSGISGVIFGVLDQNNHIDIPKNKLLLKECETLCACFHMAIDNTPDISASLETLIELGFKRVLTKGGNFENAE